MYNTPPQLFFAKLLSVCNKDLVRAHNGDGHNNVRAFSKIAWCWSELEIIICNAESVRERARQA